jgi:leucyl-tRNA synthetase
MTRMNRYNPSDIEPKWRQIWDETGVYTADLMSDRPKYIAMSMFNYPSGAGIHIGHAMNYTISDVMARYKRQQGYESYHPVGWDAFGLPAENFAIKSGVSPQQSMAKIIPSYHTQYKAMGWSNDWSKEISTHLPIYYKWTQWIFSEMFRQGLAYQDARMQWWCTKCQTVLANEQVIDGKCWRHDAADDPEVAKKEVKQWFFKITDYADELLEATDALDWSDVVKTAQKNWIGKSVGAEVEFTVVAGAESGKRKAESTLTVFTTRPDTLFGATFLVVAPEHDMLDALTTAEQSAAVTSYRKASLKKSEIERQIEGKEKTGVFTGSYAVNPVNGERVPIWVADYVLGGYGTGAIMAVPAHDERDHEFAVKFGLPIHPVVAQDFGTPLPDCKDVTGVNVIGYDPKTNKFMTVYNNNTSQLWVAGGGLEEGETYEEAARRELKEESGYTAQEIIQLGHFHYSYYYNDNKKSNRRASGYNYLAIINQKDLATAKNESHEDFSVKWLTIEELRAGIEQTKGGVEHWLYAVDCAEQASDHYVNGTEYSPEIFHGEGILINSGAFDGVSSAEARELIVQHLEREGKGRAKTTYKLRDWSVSRQRYWGAPIPIVNCPEHGAVLVSDDQLPVELPELDDFAPSGDGRSALARATEWLHTTCPVCGGPAERETDTLDTYICSSWYELRFFDPSNTAQAFDPAIANKWMPIDFYNGGDHATAHLLYVRFVARFFHKLGLLADPEPFKKFLFNGKVNEPATVAHV